VSIAHLRILEADATSNLKKLDNLYQDYGVRWQLVKRRADPLRTPWSARVPLDPLFALKISTVRSKKRPTGGSAADQRVRPAAKF
jgi:hypothetical protein